MNNGLSQNEIDALMEKSQLESPEDVNKVSGLNDIEIDTLGEIGNISMGAAATALYTIIDRKVMITTPEVSITTMEKLAGAQEVPYVVVNVDYTEGFIGNNLYVLRIDDVKAITDIMMGGAGTVSEEPLSELHISAISEAMNQMMGGMATSLAEMFSRVINISPPKSMMVKLGDDQIRELVENQKEELIQIRFHMSIEGLEDSSIMQLIPLEFGRQLVSGILNGGELPEAGQDEASSAGAGGGHSASGAADDSDATILSQEEIEAMMNAQINTAAQPRNATASADLNSQGEPLSVPLKKDPVPGAAMPAAATARPQPSVDIRPIQLSDFDQDTNPGNGDNGIDIILDVPLQVSVELGQSRKTIREVMDLNIGSVVTLDRVAGEPVDVVVNGKIVARGEVIVIDDNYGIRITEVITSSRVRTRR